MKNISFEISRIGLSDGAKEFIWSLLKTVAAAGVAFLIGEIDKLQAFIVANPESQLAYYGTAVPFIRAIGTSTWVWLTKTSASVIPVEQATETVVEVPAQG